jgi:hypothetical protein
MDFLFSHTRASYGMKLWRRGGERARRKQVPSVTIEGGISLTCLAGSECSSEIEDLEAQRQRVRLLASNAEQLLERGYAVDAILLALEALSDEKAGR